MKIFFSKPTLLLMTVSASFILSGCGDAKTRINEKASIPADNGHNHGGGKSKGTTSGRLLIVNTEQTQAEVFDLSDSALLATVSLDALPSAVYATGGYRYAALIERNADKVGFIDGGLWQEPHDDHFDLFTTTPTLSNFSLSGSRPLVVPFDLPPPWL